MLLARNAAGKTPPTPEQLRDAIHGVGTEIIAERIAFKMVELDATGLPQLTAYGEKCLVLMETVDGCVA